uniref:Uncharacterized protein n=1 Tax=Strongyloides papillosus TaxID=174720 RepID=A0A0N5BFM2_STREA
MVARIQFRILLYILFFTLINGWFYNYSEFGKFYIEYSNSFYKYKKSKDSFTKPFFKHGPLTEHLMCSQFFYQNFTFDSKERISRTIKNKLLSLTCDSIKKRRYFSPVPLSEDEKNFPLAYSFLVYKEYEFIELILSLIYQPQNVYCFAIDKKQDSTFRSRIHSLSNCFENVFVSDIEYTSDSSGSYHGTSHIECIKKLKDYNWRYIFLLQNHDFPMKTNAELVKILKLFKDTSDFKAGKGSSHILNQNLDWTIKGLNFFPDNSLIDKQILNTNISIAKGYSEVTISHAAIDYILNNINITTYQSNYDKYPKFGSDELFWPTLFSNYEYLKIPGTLPKQCIHTSNALFSFTRLSKWNYGKSATKCPSGFKRHSICILGLEFISQLEYLPHFFANKLMDNFDAGAVDCWAERVFNRTFYAEEYRKIDLLPYLSRPQIHFQEFLKNSDNISQFDCKKTYAK